MAQLLVTETGEDSPQPAFKGHRRERDPRTEEATKREFLSMPEAGYARIGKQEPLVEKS